MPYVIDPSTGYQVWQEDDVSQAFAPPAPGTNGTSELGTANSAPNPNGSGTLTPTTPAGGYKAAAPGVAKQNQVKAYSGALSNKIGGFVEQAGNRGADALSSFYGIEKPADTSQSAAQVFADENAVDPSLARNDEIDRAFGMSSGLVDQIMNTPSAAKIAGDQALSQQLAIGRSAPGGIGNVQAGVKAAMGAAPQLQAQTQQAVLQEQVQRASAATGAAQIYAGVAAGVADRSTAIAQGNQNAANAALSTMTQKYGMDLNFTTEQRGQIGQLARDFYANQAQFANMDVQQQMAAWDNIVKVYGIDQTLKAAMEQIAAQENIGPLDAFKLVLGAADAAASIATKGA